MGRVGSNIAGRWGMFLAVVGGLVSLTGGCQWCSGVGTRCDGTALQECVGGEWSRQQECAAVCLEDESGAFCSDSREPVAECSDPSRDNFVICWKDMPTICRGGYPSVWASCDPPDNHCVLSPSCGAVCAPADTPEPRCVVPAVCRYIDGDPSCRPSFCDGDDVVRCACEFAVSRSGCGGKPCLQQSLSSATCQP